MKTSFWIFISRAICTAYALYLPVLGFAQVEKDWDKRFGSAGIEGMYQIIPYQDDYLLAGDSYDGVISGDKRQYGDEWDSWLVKIKENSDTLWTHTVFCKGGASRENALQVNDSLVIASLNGRAGEITSCGIQKILGDLQITILKPDRSIAWARRYNGSRTGASVTNPKVAINSNDFFAFCYSNADAGNDKSENHRGTDPEDGTGSWNDFWVLKIDKQGNKIWDKTIGGSNTDGFSNYYKISENQFLLLGSSKSNMSYDKSENTRGSYDYWLVKIDGDGNKLWDKTFGSDQNDYGNFIIPFGTGYLLCGQSKSGIGSEKTQANIGNWDYWVVKIDANGNKEWDKTYGGTGADQLTSAIATPDGGAILSGYSNFGLSGDRSEASWGDYDYWLVKIDANGNKVWDKSFGSSGIDRLPQIALTPSGDLMIAGESNGIAYGDKSQDSRGDFDYWVVKTKPAQPFAIDDIGLELINERDGVNMRWYDYELPKIGNRYIIQRSEDNQNWVSLDTFSYDSGSYLGKTFYFGKDRNPLEGLNYYRICRISINSRRLFSNFIRTLWSRAEPRIYPNPVQNELTLIWGNWVRDQGDVSLTLIALDGRKISESTQFANDERVVFDVSTLLPGTHIAEVKFKHRTWRFKVRKE